MGQGFSLATPSAGSAGIDIPQLQDVQYEKAIGNARFMKSIRARHENGVVLVKVLVKPFAGVDLDEYKRRIIRQSFCLPLRTVSLDFWIHELTHAVEQRKALADVPNALAFQRVVETETNGYLVRQFQYNSLYDRLSTRPFLEDIEKRWLAFQLLCALRDCHAREVYHGDIKAQNVLVTSWNWLYLTDFSSPYKPVLLPDDNPGDFSYFFDTSGRRTCYLAPERFYAARDGPPPKAEMTWAMDIFSAGCVIAQMFLESELFSLAQLYKYRRGEYNPVITHLSVISDKGVRDMIAHMIQMDPEKRYSADQYLEFWKGKVFPPYFYNFLHQYMELITDPSSGINPMSDPSKNMGESDDRIDRVYNDLDKISYFLGYQPGKRSSSQQALAASRLGLSHFPIRLSIASHEQHVSADLEPPEDDGTLIFLTLIVSSIRTTTRASSRVRACDILLAFAERLTDEAKLDRVLPYLMTLLREDEPDIVIVSAIRTVTQLLQLVRLPTPINSHVIVEYVLPRMEVALGSKSGPASPLVRATYASCLGSLASTGQRFLEVASSLRADGSMPVADPEVEPGIDAEANFESVFDNAGRELFETLEGLTKQVVEDPDVHVRRAFLASVPELCVFFQDHSNDILLTHLNTYLNDRDWMLKCAFFDTVVGIATFIGSTSLEEFMLPLMVQALADAEEFVVQAAIQSLAQLTSLGLLSRTKLWELAEIVGRLTMHPNIWIREAAARFLSMCAKFLAPSDVQCILLPLIRNFLRVTALADMSQLVIMDCLKKSMSRPVFEQAVTWAMQTDRGVFWKSMSNARSMTLVPPRGSATRSAKEADPVSLSKMSRNDEDEQWLEKLRNLGLKPEDESKLLALREYIWRISQIRARDSAVSGALMDGLVSLKALGITPQTIFFNDAPLKDSSIQPDLDSDVGPYTIADALQDASMALGDSVGKKKRATLHNHNKRVHSAGPLPSRTPASLLSPKGSERLGLGQPKRGSSLGRVGGPDDDVLTGRNASYSSRRGIRHQSSALTLLDRTDGSKSAAETGTSDANALGEVEAPFSQTTPTSPASTQGKDDRKDGPKQARHSYEGTDPNIQQMLDRMYIDNFPRDVLEFGPMVSPISAGKPRAMLAQPQHGMSQWKPKGQLVATFAEHKGPVNRVVASPDHVFFVTGGSDGTVRIWDTARLERNITHRSRQTHKHAEGARVLSLCFVENSHCFISSATDGSVHIVKVDTVLTGGVVRYGKLRLVREYQLPQDEFAIWCEHYKHDLASILVLATNRSRILGLDLRTMTVLYELENPVHHGTPTCFCVDKKRNWICVGTSHGVLDLWDLRFKMRLKGWGIPGKMSIYRLCIHPTKGRGKWICVSGGTAHGDITVWDLEKTACREIYRASGVKDGPKGYSAWDVDEDRPEGMLARFATNLESQDISNADRGVRAIVVGIEAAEDSRDVRHAYLATGGSDKKLRFWDIGRPENSGIYSGLEPHEYPPTYASSQPTTGLTLNVEKAGRHGSAGGGHEGDGSSGGKSKSKGKGAAGGRPPRSTVISSMQQQLLQSHLDAVLDLAILEHPYTMSVSVDRSGVVFVFL